MRGAHLKHQGSIYGSNGVPGLLGGGNAVTLMRSFVDTYGGVMWPMQEEITDLYAQAYNSALAEGRTLVPNGEFETDISGWNDGASASSAQSSAQAHTGTYSMLVTVSAQNDYVYPDAIPIRGGSTYNIKAWVYLDGAGQVALTDYSSSNIDVAQVTTTTVGEWVLLETTAVAQKTGSYIPFIIRQFDASANDFYVDSVTMTQTNILASTAYPGPELLTNGDFSAWTGDNPDGWTITESGDATSNITEVANGMRLISDGTNTQAHQTILTIGKRYQYIVIIDSVAAGGVQIGDTAIIFDTPTSAGTYTGEFIAAGTLFKLQRKSGVATDAVISYASIVEVNPLNGTLVSATPGQPGPGRGFGLSGLYDGLNDLTDVYGAELNSMFNPNAGTLHVVGKCAAGVWTDSTARILVRLWSDANNYIQIARTTTDNQLQFAYSAGGTLEEILDTSIGGRTDWFLLTLTWEKPGNVTAYINGVQVGTPQAIAGTWAGNLLSTQTIIGAAATTPSAVWSGYISPVQKLRSALSANEVANLARSLGVYGG